MKVSDYIINYLKDYTDHIFMLPGGNAMHLVDSVGKSNIGYTICLHEQSCAFAAIGYAEYTGKLGVCITTSAPGAINALTGCAAAYSEGVPVLFISGQTSTNFLRDCTRLMGVQGISIMPSFLCITHYLIEEYEEYWNKSKELTIDFFKRQLEHAVKCAITPRCGSTWLEIPLDIQAMEIE